MYRIRRQTGDELTLASIDELAAAVAAGRVTADDEIFHQRADRWLSIASHPHFKLASDRVQAAKPAPEPPPASADEPGQPALRLVKNDESAAGPRVTARWKEPPRLVKQPVALRSPSSAVPAPQPAHEPAPAPSPAPKAEAAAEEATEPTPAPKPRTHVERATDGLPLLDVGALPPIPPRAPTPAPKRGPLFDMAKLAPRPAPTPMPQRAPTPAPAPTSAPKLAARQLPSPMPAPTVASASPLPPARPMMPSVEESLDVPPPVRDFSAPYAAPEKPVAVATPAPEPAVTAAVAAPRLPTPAPMVLPELEPAPAPVASVAAEAPVVAAVTPEVELVVDASVDDTPLEPVAAVREPGTAARARWPMLLGALAMLAVIGLVMLRPRATVDPLAPQRAVAAERAPAPSAPTPAQATPVTPASATDAAPAASQEASTPSRTPAYVVDLPDAPPPTAAKAVEEEPVVPAAPSLGAIPQPGDIGALTSGLEVDPTAAQRQRSLEQTRRQIDQKLRAQE